MNQTYEKTLGDMQKGKFAPIYLFHGTEAYLIDQLTDTLLAQALPPEARDFNQQVLYGRDTDGNAVAGACSRYPMMSDRQVVVVKEAANLKNIAGLEGYIQNPAQTTVLAIAHKEKLFDKRLKIYKHLEGKAVIVECKPLSDAKVHEWLITLAKAKEVTLGEGTVDVLLATVGNDMYGLENAITQLGLANEGEAVTPAQIVKAIGMEKEFNTYELIKAISTGDSNKSTQLVEYMLRNVKENPIPRVVAMLYPFFAKSYALFVSGNNTERAKEIGITAWSLKDHQLVANRYGHALRDVLDTLFRYDLRFKGVDDVGTPDKELLKELLILTVYQ